jgi:Tol biopolymer transport system component
MSEHPALMTQPSTIAHYRIASKLGEGGMGAVYLAIDTKLNREVAIKVLPDALAGDPDYLARFTREAQVLASLNHPNIATVHGVEDRALVMELVPGPTLEEKIARGPIPLDEALEIARQIAEALEAAHERGIIHRDLKPANIKVTAEGVVKVLDFGLAKAAEPSAATASAANSPTMSVRATQAGLIMGTAGYMSPEQAAGKPADKRADIWSFGVVMYEMLSGARLFEGETVAHTLASVLRDEIVFGKLPGGTPPVIREMVSRCLDRNVKMRLRDIGEARVAIQKVLASPQGVVEGAVPVAAVAKRRSILGPAAGLAAGLALTAGVMLWRAPKPEDRPLLRFSADMGQGAVVGTRTGAVLSPDGSRVAYPVRQGTARLMATRLMDQPTATVLPGTEQATDLFFSPDGQWIGFIALGKMKKVSVLGGAPLALCDASGVRGATWSADGWIYASLNGTQLSRVPAAGGKPEVVTHSEQHGELWHRWPQALPGGTGLLVTVMPNGDPDAGSDAASVAVLSLETRQLRTVVKAGFFGRYVPGYLLYVSQNTVFAIKFDAKRLEAQGSPVPVLSGVATGEGNGAALFDISLSGTAVYAAELGVRGALPVVWLDAGGTRSLMPTPPERVTTPRFSPDGKLLAVSMNRELWVFDPQRGSSTRLTSKISASYPVWTPDGKYIVFDWIPRGLGWVRADGSLPAQSIYEGPSTVVPQSFTPDGRHLLMHQGTSTSINNRDIYVLPLDVTDPEHPKAGTPQMFVATEAADVDPMLSPDGKWVAYALNTRRGREYQVFVRPFPAGAQGGGQVQISSVPGRFPMWSRSASELFYVSGGGHIQVVPFTVSGHTFTPGKPSRWSEQAIQLNGVAYPIDIAPNGKSFVASLPAEESDVRTNLHLTFLVNFLDELKRKLP